MKKYFSSDGVTREFTPEEYDQDRICDEKIALDLLETEQKINNMIRLRQKFKDPLEAIDKICKFLNINFEDLE